MRLCWPQATLDQKAGERRESPATVTDPAVLNPEKYTRFLCSMSPIIAATPLLQWY